MAPKMSPEYPKRDPQTTKVLPKSVQAGHDGPQTAQTGSETDFGAKEGGLRDERGRRFLDTKMFKTSIKTFETSNEF